jgi:hypothetical protein
LTVFSATDKEVLVIDLSKKGRTTMEISKMAMFGFPTSRR